MRELRIGAPAVVEAAAPRPLLAVVFEDDGETGYLYAVDRSRPDGAQILDAVAVYVVSKVPRPAASAGAAHPLASGRLQGGALLGRRAAGRIRLRRDARVRSQQLPADLEVEQRGARVGGQRVGRVLTPTPSSERVKPTSGLVYAAAAPRHY